MSKLVIVESPTKAKTLTKLLGKGYIVEASMGHVRDLPKKKLGVDVEDTFDPEYEIPTKAKKHLTKLRKALKEVDTVVLATDPDREGEAIAWHLQEILKKTRGAKSKKYERVVFHEITKNAVEEAFSHATELNMDLVDAQQARRILDRLVGYRLSPLLWKKVRYGLSAGRVQSVAVRLVVERERERDAFNPDEYWSIEGDFMTQSKESIKASLSKKDGKKIEVEDEKTAKTIETSLKDSTFKVDNVKFTERSRKPYAPFKTSTLQQASVNIFGFTAKKTMSTAQKLFEKGLITYHRTDSFSLSPEFTKASEALLIEKFGKEYVPATPNIYKTKSKNAQEAHEAIRPTDLEKIPSSDSKLGLTDNEFKVYSLIYKRALESQCVPAVYDRTSIAIGSSSGYEFKASGSVIKFDGWYAIGKLLGFEGKVDDDSILPKVKADDPLDLNILELEQHFTQPPARYSDASLIKTLEELEIGRPSTYAPTISTILARKYIRRENRYFIPEDVAYVVTDLLVKHFGNVVDYDFTAGLEDNLDKVAAGELEWKPFIKEFFIPFEKTVKEKDKELHKADVTNLGKSDENCPDCGKHLNIKLGKYGKFLSCSGFPECEFAKPMAEDVPVDSDGNVIDDFGTCTECEDGKMLLRQGKFGKFLACSNYPKCKTSKPYLDKIGMDCPDCENGEVIVKKAKGRTFYGCSNYPDCKYASWKNPLGITEDGNIDLKDPKENKSVKEETTSSLK